MTLDSWFFGEFGEPLNLKNIGVLFSLGVGQGGHWYLRMLHKCILGMILGRLLYGAVHYDLRCYVRSPSLHEFPTKQQQEE